MVALTMSNERVYNVNLLLSKSLVYVGRMENAWELYLPNGYWKQAKITPWKKYQIKETDMREKTATLTTTQPLDLTTGLYVVLITSPYHEDFMGIFIKVKYDEDKELYEYQLQDWSRKHQSKYEIIADTTLPTYALLRSLITLGEVSMKATLAQLNKCKNVLSGLRRADLYEQSYWGSTVKFNPMTMRRKVIIRDVSAINAIKDLIYSLGSYIDIHYDKYGVLQFEPYHKQDWLNTGLHLYSQELASRTPEFDTTNIITSVQVLSNDSKKMGNLYASENIINLHLSAFFGRLATHTSNPNEKTETPTTSKQSSTTTNTSNNPYGNKAKKVWIDADSGSGTTKNNLANALRKKGWTVHVGGTGPGYHYSDYFNVTKDYQCLITIYNGFCAGTIREAYSSRIQNVLKKKGVVLIPCFITSGWTNPRGMKPYRYGDFSGYNASRAWDDNFSSGNPSIKNVGAWLKNNNAKYLCYPSVDGLVTQFLAGGYFAWKGK